MKLISESTMLTRGLWAPVTSGVPSYLVGGRKPSGQGPAVHGLSVLLLLVLPTAFRGGLVLLPPFGRQGTMDSSSKQPQNSQRIVLHRNQHHVTVIH
jgi:hypothetical protein